MQQHDEALVRRSVALPPSLIEDLRQAGPPELRSNLNRLVILALEAFVETRRRRQFEDAMARMAADPAVQAEIREIQAEFRPAEFDGLAGDENW